MPASVCVIGSGVIGLSTAISLKRNGYSVSIFTHSTGKATTSSVAAAFWYPFWTGSKPDHTWYRPEWAASTYYTLSELSQVSNSGVFSATLWEFFDSEMTDHEVEAVIKGMWWQGIPQAAFHVLDSRELHKYGCLDRTFGRGIGFSTYVVDMDTHLPFLMNECDKLRVYLEETETLLELEDVQRLLNHSEFVVNCTGLGSRDLFGDETFDPESGREGVLVKISSIEDFDKILLAHTGPFFGETFPLYAVPRGSKDIVLGGTIRIDREGDARHFSTSDLALPEEEITLDAIGIRHRCISLEPKLGDAKILGVSVGYRPARQEGVRLEPGAELGTPSRLIHNYGHGGGGVTLSWGCAEAVEYWVRVLGR